MMKRLLIALLSVGVAMQLQGCTSNSASEDGDVATSSENGDFPAENKGDFEGGGEGDPEQAAAPSDDPGALPDDPGAVAADDPGKSSEPGLDDADPEHEFPENVAMAPPSTDDAPASEPPPTDAPTDAPMFAGGSEPEKPASDPMPAPMEDPAPKPEISRPSGPVVFAPLLKIKDQPFSQRGALLNRVYIARKSDNWKSVGEKIYGMNRASDLKKWNPGISGRSLKVGDKVYYNSPKEPSDNARMLVFYEEQGIAAQSYVAKDGDNLRRVGKELLGDSNSWKELWVTNRDLASKSALPAGTELKYWPDAVAGSDAPVLAGAPSELPPMGAPTAAPSDGLVPPPPGVDPTADPMAMGGADKNGGSVPPPVAPSPFPSPAPAVAQVEPPPPPPPAAKKPPKAIEPVEPASSDQDMTLYIGLGGICVLAALGLFIVQRKNRAKHIDLSQTQV